MVLAYVFWVAVTVLVVFSLGRLKRWLLERVEKKKRPDQGV